MGSLNSGRAPFNLDNVITKTVPNGAGNGAALPNLPCHTVMVKAICAAGQKVYLGRTADGAANLLAAMADGNKNLQLSNGEFVIFEVQNANKICMLADAAGAFVCLTAGHF